MADSIFDKYKFWKHQTLEEFNRMYYWPPNTVELPPRPLFTKEEIQQLVDTFRRALYGRSQVTFIPHNPDSHKAKCVTI